MTTTASGAQLPLIRLAHPLAFAAFLQKVGAPTERLFRRTGLPVYCDDPGALVPLRLAWSLFDAAAQSEDPILGWHVGKFCGNNKLSFPFVKSIEHAPTLYRALQRFVRLINTEASHLQLGIQERRGDIVLYTHYPDIKDWPGYQSSQSYQLEVFVDIVRHYLGSHWDPPEIGIEHSEVPIVAQEHFPGSRIRTGQLAGYITVPRTYLHHRPLGGVQPAPSEKSLRVVRDFGFVETLKAVATAYLEEGYPSVERMALLMSTSPRTLFRRLREQGLTYQSLIDEVRYRKAQKLLQDPDLKIGDISRSVGFDDPSHFSRMFRRIAGLSPSRFRSSVQV